jgi:hypothetical protein
MVKVFRTIHSGPVWQMSCWVREEQRYFRKSLRTKLLEEAKHCNGGIRCTEGPPYCTMRLMAGVSVFLLARNMGTSVKYIEEHYGHVDIDVMRKELTRERRKVDHAMRAIME